MIELTITTAEKKRGHLTPAHLKEAVRAVREDGFVVLHEAIDTKHI